jgi:aspartate/methionine/tyrosine aminotransferase
MKIAPFGIEQWMNEWETRAALNLAETCVDSLTVGELLEISGEEDSFTERMRRLRLSYGDIRGSGELLDLIASLYQRQDKENVIVMNGGVAANFISLYTLVEPGDEVVSIYPTYQQLYSIPESFGAKVKLLPLRRENGFLPDMNELKSLVTPKTKLICLNNPNNPTGSLLNESALKEVVNIAGSAGAWILCDEAYRFMTHGPEERVSSMADLYDRGIVSCSMSKCFSLAGLRIGWVAGPQDFIEDVFKRRDYTTISCGCLNDMLACIALRNRDKIFARNLGIVRKCASILDEWVNSEPRIDTIRPRSGTTAFLRYDYGIRSEDFCLRLLKRDRTFLLPGRCFGEEFDRYVRIGYAYSPGVLSDGLKRVSAFLRELEKEGF